MKRTAPAAILASALIAFSCTSETPSALTRGIGVYPGSPDEYTGPAMVSGAGTYRNLASLRRAWASSSYDYNLTAQLAADGITEASEPAWMSVTTQDGPVIRKERERLFDDNMTVVTVKAASDAYLEVLLHNSSIEFDEISLEGFLGTEPTLPQGYEFAFEVTSDGENWTPAGSVSGPGLPGKARLDRLPDNVLKAKKMMAQAGSQDVSVAEGLGATGVTKEDITRLESMMKTRDFTVRTGLNVDGPVAGIRVRLNVPAATTWSFKEMNLLSQGREVSPLTQYDFHSAWMSEGCSDEWIYVDLGADAKFDKVVLNWISRPKSGVLEVSDDARTWRKVAELPSEGPAAEELKVNAGGRFVRLSGLSSDSRIVLSEMEVWGKGGERPQPKAQPEAEGNRMYLSGGAWSLQRASLVEGDGAQISQTGYDASSWLTATVPATVASSYYNAGAIPDIRYDDDQLQISESFFMSDFWYRDEFVMPEQFLGKEVVLNFDGINWKADIYFNSVLAGHIDGAFIRGRFDVTGLVRPGANALAVKIYRNDNPGIIKEQDRISADINGGILGADNPTMHCAIGWDWIPTVRGRNIGIWNDVFLSCHDGGVSIDDVFVDTDLPLPAMNYADLSPVVTLTNHGGQTRTVDVKMTYGELPISATAVVEAGATVDVALPVTRLDSPQIWWPNGYGEHPLYDVRTVAMVDGRVSDTKTQKSGVREMSYKPDGEALDLYVNGRRLICNGGNWGYPEINLNYRGREYDIAVAYHADMNYTMIRDWVGQTGDEEFYEACDRHGIMVWQDFWLANPWDGPDPDCNSMFMKNAEDYVRKIRNHPSLAIYVGRNEGYPPQELNDGLEALVARLHPGMQYIPHSAEGCVSGNGPYRALPVAEYFAATRGRDRLHSERGMPNVMTYESLTRMLRPENHWPQTSVWGVHDYTMENAQSCATFNGMIATAFGEPQDLRQFTSWAQWINYNGYRAMYESRSWQRKGLLIWMSHSCWPSMVWQSYDYYFEPTAAYFGIKKGSAPIRIQWNPLTSAVEVVNNNAGDLNGLTAHASVLSYDGKILWETSAALDAKEDTTISVCQPPLGDIALTDTYFIKLRLDQDGRTVADNFYWEDKEDGGCYRQLLSLPQVGLDVKKSMTETETGYRCEVILANNTETPALMIRLHARAQKSGESIVPAFYGDNFFSLMPGESKTVGITFKKEDAHGEKPEIAIEGFNLR